MIFLKTEDEIELLRESNLLVGRTLAEVAKLVKPGVTTKELDKVAEEFIRDHGAVPTFKGFPNQYGDPFPASLCTSINEQGGRFYFPVFILGKLQLLTDEGIDIMPNTSVLFPSKVSRVFAPGLGFPFYNRIGISICLEPVDSPVD